MCLKTYGTINDLQKHEQLDHQKKQYKCKCCPKFFVSIYTRRRHENMHQMLYKCKCTECGAGYADNTALDIHMNAIHLKVNLLHLI